MYSIVSSEKVDPCILIDTKNNNQLKYSFSTVSMPLARAFLPPADGELHKAPLQTDRHAAAALTSS